MKDGKRLQVVRRNGTNAGCSREGGRNLSHDKPSALGFGPLSESAGGMEIGS